MNFICGLNPVLEALQAHTRHFDRLIVVKGLRNQRVSEAIARASRLGVPLRFESRETLDRIAAGVPHQGVIAVVSAKPTIDLDALLAQAREPALLVALDGVEDPRNLGAIVRTCDAAGADGVLLPERHSAGLTETVGRASAGALEHVRVARVGNLAQAIEALKARGLWVIGFDAGGQQRWSDIDYKRPLAIVLGGEGRGIRRLVRERCDEVVSIPLFGQVASLNVSVAAGVALYEVVRQRGAVPTHVRPIRASSAPSPVRIEGPAAGDDTHDPGASPAHVHGIADSEEDAAFPINLVRHFDEDIAWGPALASSASSDGRERDRERGPEHSRERGGRRRQEGRQEGQQRQEAPASPAAGEARAASGPGDDRDRRFGRGRRKRRRPHPQDAGTPTPGERPDQPRPSSAGAEPQAAGEPRTDSTAAGAADSRRRGRRRRWRKRGAKPAG